MILFQIPKKPVKMEKSPNDISQLAAFFWSRNKSSPPEVERQTRLKFVWCVCRSTDRDAAHQVCLWFTRLDGDSLNDSNDGWFSNRKAPGDFVRYTKKVITFQPLQLQDDWPNLKMIQWIFCHHFCWEPLLYIQKTRFQFASPVALKPVTVLPIE